LNLRNILTILVFWCLSAEAATSLQTIDSLLTAYLRAPAEQKYVLGPQILDICLDDDVLADRQMHIDGSTPADSADLLVFFAAERFYYIHAYFQESVDFIEKALPLAKKGNQTIHATLLCDNCYCLYKQGKLTEAAQAGQKAMEFCMAHDEQMQLTRAYLYLAIVNYGIPQMEEAKQFVEKAIATDKHIGVNNNSHNILGIACEIYSYAGETERAIDYGEQAVEAARKIGYEEGVINHLSQLSYAYHQHGDYERGLAMAQQAVEAVEKMEIPDRNLLALSLEYKADNLIALKRNDEAVTVLLRAIELQEEVGNKRSVCCNYKVLAKAYEPKDPRQAIAALRKYIVLADSIQDADMKEALSTANAKFQNEELKAKNIEQQQRNRFFVIASILVALFLIAIIIYYVRAYRKRGKANQELRRYQKEKEMFFTNITHEFRTPLTVILGQSRHLLNDEPEKEEEAARAAQLIEHECNRLLQLVNQTLDIVKMQMAVITPQWQRNNIVPLLSMLTESMQQIAADRGITLTYEPQQQELEADFVTDYVQKIVRNLLSNALKYTPEGGQVKMTSLSEGGRMRLIISDTGQGIDVDDLPHIFDPFYQGRNSIAKQGNGIGLAMVVEMVKAMHGTISAESTTHSGTTFNISLPMHQKGIGRTVNTTPVTYSNEAVDEAAGESNTYLENYKAPQLIDSPTSNDNGRPSVLIVEDNTEVAYYTGSLLVRYYDVFYAEDGEQGIEKAKQLFPDIIITDLMMPRMDGLQLCRHIRHELLTCHIPIIVVTAKVTEESHRQGLEAGATVYLNKPFNADELLLQVNNLLAHQRLLQERFAMLSMADESTTQETTDKNHSMETTNKNHNMETTDKDLSIETTDVLVSPLDELFISRLKEVLFASMKKQHTDIGYLSIEMKMSQTQLRRKITAVTGMSPAKYIMQIRLNEAKKMLRSYPNITIMEVALNTGFANNAHFTTVFHHYTGMTPMQYIKSVK